MIAMSASTANGIPGIREFGFGSIPYYISGEITPEQLKDYGVEDTGRKFGGRNILKHNGNSYLAEPSEKGYKLCFKM